MGYNPQTPRVMAASSPHFFVGIDAAAETFAATVFQGPGQPSPLTETFSNDVGGFEVFLAWLAEAKATEEATLVCVEATGVYAEALLYYVHAQGYAVALESPHRVKRAFKTSSNKNDPTDSQQIAEYAFRFLDELTPWQPREALIEQIRTLLAAREQLVTQLSQNRNVRHMLEKKVVQTPTANAAFDAMITSLRGHIQAIEEEIRRLIRQSPTLSEMLTLLVSIPSVGLLLSAHLMVVTDGFRREVSARQLAAYVGICPYEHTSGSSVKKPSRSRRYGPPVLRKLLYLAAMTLRQHSEKHRRYYARKVAEGKSPRLVLNNLENKLLRVICAVIRDRRPYEAGYRSVSPQALRAA